MLRLRVNGDLGIWGFIAALAGMVYSHEWLQKNY